MHDSSLGGSIYGGDGHWEEGCAEGAAGDRENRLGFIVLRLGATEQLRCMAPALEAAYTGAAGMGRKLSRDGRGEGWGLKERGAKPGNQDRYFADAQEVQHLEGGMHRCARQTRENATWYDSRTMGTERSEQNDGSRTMGAE